MSALEARDWLTVIDGIGKKTASVLLLFSFGLPLMPVDRHVERVAQRVGLIGPKATADDAHDLFLGMLEPDQMYEAHVNLIQHGRKVCHAQRPNHADCPLLPALPLRRPEGALTVRGPNPRHPLVFHSFIRPPTSTHGHGESLTDSSRRQPWRSAFR